MGESKPHPVFIPAIKPSYSNTAAIKVLCCQYGRPLKAVDERRAGRFARFPAPVSDVRFRSKVNSQ
jgi:hypothetical protein